MNSETASVPSFNAPPVVEAQTQQSASDRLWSVCCHLSYFFGFALLSFIFPLLVYLVMRTESAYSTHHAREALNFHLSILLYIICCVPLCLIVVGIPLLVLIGLAGVVCSIVAAVKASKGVFYEYPFAIRFVR
ncbi:MAG TPA: DUF4870 domain-containing protein [Opitutaceae bacterium]|jgi:hypothetical protein